MLNYFTNRAERMEKAIPGRKVRAIGCIRGSRITRATVSVFGKILGLGSLTGYSCSSRSFHGER